MNGVSSEEPAVKEEMLDEEEITSERSTTTSSLLNLVKQELSTLKTEGDCVITDLHISEPTGVAKYEVISEAPNISCNGMPRSDRPIEVDKPDPLTGTKYVCDVCDKTTTSKSGLLVHKSKVHQQIETLESSQELSCYVENCGKKFRKMLLLKDHLKLSHSLGNVCPHCGKSFTHLRAMKRHIKFIHLKEPKSFKCEICEKRFSYPRTLRMHIKCVHLKEPKSFRCKTCEKQFYSRSRLGIHIKYVHLKEPKPFRCETCEKLFESRSRLAIHIKCVHLKEPFRCETCEKLFLSKSALRRHTRYVHLKEPKPFGCETCEIRFESPGHLKRHINFVHLREPRPRPFRCETCEKLFHSRYSLGIHIKFVHLKEPKPFRCETCEKLFRSSQYLRNHIRYVHLKTPKPFKCETCEKLFIYRSELIQHIKCAHEPPKPCPHCGKSFRRLNEHIKWVHCDPSMTNQHYCCSICKKKFKSQKDLTGHERVHWAIRPYACSQCKFCTHKENLLSAHIERIHRKSVDSYQTNQAQEKSSETIDLSADSRIDVFTCKDCSESFNTEIELDLHKISATHNQKFPNNTVNSSESSHIQEKSSETTDLSAISKINGFRCKDCSEMFNTEIEFDFHKISAGHNQKLSKKSVSSSTSKAASTNMKTKSFQCTVCHQMFTSKYNLERHQIVHTREKVSCPKCSKVLASKDSLRNHIRTQHSHSDSVITANIFVCKGCGETFMDQKVLTKHMKYCVHL